MRSIYFAEWILGLVTSEERAASTVGDLVEQGVIGSRWRFWSVVLRIGASLLWRGIAEQPLRMIGVAVVGLALDAAASFFLAGVTGILFFMEARNGHLHAASLWWTIWLYLPTFLLALPLGRLLAYWAPRRELSACLAYAIFGSLLSFVLMMASSEQFDTSALLTVFLAEAALRIPVLAGAMWGRRSRLSANA